MWSMISRNLKIRAAGLLGALHIFVRGSNPLLLLDYWRHRKRSRLSHDDTPVVRADLYKYFSFAYWWRSPKWLRAHRFYFSRHHRGFGEDPFHAAWLEIILHLKPAHALEIGVYRGQTISLWQLIAKKYSIDLTVYGLSPMSDTSDSVSRYVSIDYKTDILSHFAKFKLKPPVLFEALSTEQKAISFIESRSWDLIYIAGSHDYEVVVRDYLNAVKILRIGWILCLDDSSLFLDFRVDGLFKGHPGPSRVVSDVATKELRHLMPVCHNNFFRKER